MEERDTDSILAMMRVFYDSPAVLNKASDQILKQDIADCIGTCPFVEGYVFEEKGIIAGYAMVAKSYSTEYGGICIWIEDLYLKPEFRKCGFGTKFFTMLDQMYQNKAVRFRLDVEEENVHAVHTYKKNGFQELPYLQMSKEFNQ